MRAIIQKSNNLKGAIIAPSSKSQTIRGLILGLLANGTSTLSNPLHSDDTKEAIKVCEDLGAKIKASKNQITIKSKVPIESKTGKINAGNSGITTRFILPVLGLRSELSKPTNFDCGQQMKKRPIASLVNALNDLGMVISYKNQSGKCPLVVSGRLKGGKTQIDGITSQYLSALLLSLPLAPNDSEIEVKNLHERPYVDMTLNWLNKLGIKYTHRNIGKTDAYQIKGGQKYHGFKKVIPGDFSSASCLLVAGCLLGSKVVLKGLSLKDSQGDKKIVEILKRMGADINTLRGQIVVKSKRVLHGVNIDANNIPDLLPALAVIATQAKGKTIIKNVKQARIKETDRIKSMTKGLRRMGAKIEEKSDGMIVYKSRLRGARVRGFNDHRTAMALTVAGLIAEGKTQITGSEAVNKTFPGFVSVMKKLGARIKLYD